MDEYANIFIRLHDLFDSGKGKLVVLEEIDILWHLIDLFFDLLELRLKVFEVAFEV
jgi:hypothetical protein